MMIKMMMIIQVYHRLEEVNLHLDHIKAMTITMIMRMMMMIMMMMVVVIIKFKSFYQIKVMKKLEKRLQKVVLEQNLVRQLFLKKLQKYFLRLKKKSQILVKQIKMIFQIKRMLIFLINLKNTTFQQTQKQTQKQKQKRKLLIQKEIQILIFMLEVIKIVKILWIMQFLILEN